MTGFGKSKATASKGAVGKFGKGKGKAVEPESDEDEAPKGKGFGKGKAAAKGKKKASRWGGVKSAAPRTPQLGLGDYRLRYLRSEETENEGTGNETHKTYFEVVGSDGATKEGTEIVTLNVISGKAKSAGMSRVKAQNIAIAGHETDDTFDEIDPDGELFDAMLGEANDHSVEATDDNPNGDPMFGRLVDVSVTQGNPLPSGDGFYNDYAWSVVDEDDQDVPAFGS